MTLAWSVIDNHGTQVLPMIETSAHYPLVNVYITMENHNCSWVNQQTKGAMASIAM